MRSPLFATLFLAPALAAQIPPGYYASVNPTSASTLRATLHAVIDDHVEFPYTASGTDTWDILDAAQQDPARGGNVLDVYRNSSYRKEGGGNSRYDREHVWPRSYGFPVDQGGPYTDCHQLQLAHIAYNSARSNLPFATCSAACAEHPTVRTNGQGGGSGVFPGNSNWSSGSGANGTWQVWSQRRGDIARALLYLDVRYEGGLNARTGRVEPDLILTDDRALIAASNTGATRSVAHMGLLSTLLQWHAADPPDAFERRRNDVVYGFQRNRNPFVDHPEWVAIVHSTAVPGAWSTFGAGCPDATGFPPQISAIGQPVIGRSFPISLRFAPRGQPAVLNVDSLQQSVGLGALGFPGCTALALPVFSFGLTTSVVGTGSVPLGLPNQGVLVGTNLFCQWAVLDVPNADLVVSAGGQLTIGRL